MNIIEQYGDFMTAVKALDENYTPELDKALVESASTGGAIAALVIYDNSIVATASHNRTTGEIRITPQLSFKGSTPPFIVDTLDNVRFGTTDEKVRMFIEQSRKVGMNGFLRYGQTNNVWEAINTHRATSNLFYVAQPYIQYEREVFKQQLQSGEFFKVGDYFKLHSGMTEYHVEYIDGQLITAKDHNGVINTFDAMEFLEIGCYKATIKGESRFYA